MWLGDFYRKYLFEYFFYMMFLNVLKVYCKRFVDLEDIDLDEGGYGMLEDFKIKIFDEIL